VNNLFYPIPCLISEINDLVVSQLACLRAQQMNQSKIALVFDNGIFE
jgi:hypothetical protein